MDFAPLGNGAADAVSDALDGRAAGIAVSTSGSTGEPGTVLLSSEALRASAAATAERLGGHGHWVLALPTDRIAGAMVLVRSRIGGTRVAKVSAGSFSAASFASALAKLPTDAPRFAALVPTQVTRLLTNSHGRDALAELDAVLVGGAPAGHLELPPNAIVTYGMTETAGGCVYDGRPIGDTEVDIDETGRILISGSTLADGYVPERPEAWLTRDGRRWLVTSDTGSIEDGVLTVHGRIDQVINTGGFKVHPATVEAAVGALPWVGEVAVIGMADDSWGERVTACVVLRRGASTVRLWELRNQLEQALPKHALPAELLTLEALPRLKGGKVDYGQLRRLAARLAKHT